MARDDPRSVRTTTAPEAQGPTRHGIPMEGRPDRILPRTAAVERLRSDPSPIVVVHGPAGSGKTTLLAQWARADPRPSGWLTIDTEHSDPVRLVGSLARVLAAVHPSGAIASLPRRIRGSDALRGLARLTRALDEEQVATLLVIDDLHLLTDQRAVDLVVTLADRWPGDGRIALSGRTDSQLPLARWQLSGRALVVDHATLDLDLGECARLLERLGVANASDVAPTVHRRTEGWAAGVQLMGLSHIQRDGRQPDAGHDMTTLATGFLRSELLDRLEPATRTMLVRTSLLEVVTGPLADAVCDAHDSGRRLSEVAARGLFVTSLDQAGHAYRYHSLLRDVLAAELAEEPLADLDARLRAAAWYRHADMVDEAIEQALGAGDLDQAAAMLLEVGQARYRTGETASIQRWLGAFDEAALRDRPDLCSFAINLFALEGDAQAAARWAAFLGTLLSTDMPPDGLGPGADLVSAMLCERGPDEMLRDAERALGAHDAAWRWRPTGLLAVGSAALMLGRDEMAADRFSEFERVQDAGVTMARLVTRAERALAHMAQRRWPEAQAILDADRQAVLVDPESGRIAGLAWLVADMHLAVHRGDMRTAQERLQRVQVGRVRLTSAIPWLAVRVLTELARAQLRMDDLEGARVTVSQAHDVVAVRPRLGRLVGDLELVTQQALAAPRGEDRWSSLTRAELRLLPLLQTYLTIKEIGERLGVSPNTAKTQALSIYGKLRASTRSEAVEAAVARGLLEDVFADRGGQRR